MIALWTIHRLVCNPESLGGPALMERNSLLTAWLKQLHTDPSSKGLICCPDLAGMLVINFRSELISQGFLLCRESTSTCTQSSQSAQASQTMQASQSIQHTPVRNTTCQQAHNMKSPKSKNTTLQTDKKDSQKQNHPQKTLLMWGHHSWNFSTFT